MRKNNWVYFIVIIALSALLAGVSSCGKGENYPKNAAEITLWGSFEKNLDAVKKPYFMVDGQFESIDGKRVFVPAEFEFDPDKGIILIKDGFVYCNAGNGLVKSERITNGEFPVNSAWQAIYVLKNRQVFIFFSTGKNQPRYKLVKIKKSTDIYFPLK